jgi:hypothetical protein
MLKQTAVHATNKATTNRVLGHMFSRIIRRLRTRPITTTFPQKVIPIPILGLQVIVQRTIQAVLIIMGVVGQSIPDPKADSTITTVMVTKPMFPNGNNERAAQKRTALFFLTIKFCKNGKDTKKSRQKMDCTRH